MDHHADRRMDQNNYTPLHLAALHGLTSAVEQLLTSGASIEAMDKDGNTL